MSIRNPLYDRPREGSDVILGGEIYRVVGNCSDGFTSVAHSRYFNGKGELTGNYQTEVVRCSQLGKL